jgi:branched-chain amino acid transport system ATP-binding protein
VLNVSVLSSGYGGSPVLRNVSIQIRQGEIVSLIGANGAGKTTLMKTLAGIVKPIEGKVEFLGADISGCFPPKAVEMGMSLVFEGRRIFPSLTVIENLKVGAYKRPLKEVRSLLEVALGLFPRLGELGSRLGGNLSGGEQQMLAIARALMAAPKLLLLDEPSMGLAPLVVEHIFDKLVELKRKGLTMLMVEQNAMFALEIADRGYVLENGEIMKSGAREELLHDPQVEEAYLAICRERTQNAS